MPSTHDDSSGTPGSATPRSVPPETTAENDCLTDLIARSERAVDDLLASTDWAAHDAAMAQLADEADAAAHHYHLLLSQPEALTHGTGPCVSSGLEDRHE